MGWLFPDNPWDKAVKDAHARGKTEQAKAARARDRAVAREKQRKADAKKSAGQLKREREIRDARARIRKAYKDRGEVRFRGSGRARASDKPRGFFYWS